MSVASSIVTTIRCALLLAAVIFSGLVQAQVAADYPVKPIRLLVPQEAGSAADNGVRAIAPALGEALGQTLVVENRPGAGGVVGMMAGAAAPADGYTLISVGAPQMVSPYVNKSASYDLFRDFVPVGRYSINHNVLVVPVSLPVRNVRELVALAKSKPGQLNMGIAGSGSVSHLSGVLFNVLADIQSLVVPYKGGGGAVVALMANEIQYYLSPLPSVMGQIKSGRLKPLAVGGENRTSQLPDVPTIAEDGIPAYRSVSWIGLLLPKGTPAAILAKVMDKLTVIMASPVVRQQLMNTGAEPSLLLGAEFEKFMREDFARVGIAAKAANLRPE